MAGKLEIDEPVPQPLGLAQGLRSVFNRLSNAAYSMSHQFRRLADIMQGHGALSQSKAWIMGAQYGTAAQDGQPELTEEAKQALFEDLHSRVWCTYRRDFPPLGTERLDSDVGWGCTIRSGQMMMAEALSRHTLGRTWRFDALPSTTPNPEAQSSQPSCLEGSAYGERLIGMLSHLLDKPEASLSIHEICNHGKAQGMVPGKWLGPWVLCRALASLVNNTPDLGLQLHVVCDPGGGAPTLHVTSLLAMMTQQQQPAVDQHNTVVDQVAPQPSVVSLDSAVDVLVTGSESLQQADSPPAALDTLQSEQQAVDADDGEPAPGLDEVSQPVPAAEHAEETVEAAPTEAAAAAAGDDVVGEAAAAEDEAISAPAAAAPAGSVQIESGSAPVEPPVGAGAEPVGANQAGAEQQQGAQLLGAPPPAQPSQPTGLVLLLPLTLGVGKANPLYYPQLLQVLTFPQSIGIVGGRPCASLFLVGHQDQNLLYLDPHIPQACGSLPAALPSYFCNMVRLMPISSIDPSLAIGFYCSDSGDLLDLVARLESLAVQHSSAPIVTIAKGRHVDSSQGGLAADSPPAAGRQDGAGPREEDLDSWEVL